MFDRLIELFVEFLHLFQFWTVVDEYQRGIVLRFGKLQKQLDPGLHWVIPFGVDRVVDLIVVTTLAALPPTFLTIKDGTTVSVAVIVRYNIRDVTKALLDVNHVMDAIKDSVSGAVSVAVRNATWAELESPDFAAQLPKECRKKAWRYGVEIEDVILDDLCKVKMHGILNHQHPITHLIDPMHS
jgi:regulator of protease activity HflC (stomatin/prohibitin superfamily)